MEKQIEQSDEFTGSAIAAAYPVGSRATSQWERSLVGEVVGYGSQGVMVRADSDGKVYVLRVSEIVAL